MRSFAGVYTLVRDERRTSSETFAADCARVRTLSGVNAYVLLQPTRVDEFVETNITFVAFQYDAVRTVRALVLNECRPIVKRSRTKGALVRSLPRMRASMGNQMRTRRERS